MRKDEGPLRRSVGIAFLHDKSFKKQKALCTNYCALHCKRYRDERDMVPALRELISQKR